MVSREEIRSLINECEETYESCWLTLTTIKQDSENLALETLLEYQPSLASSLFKLDKKHRQIREEERSLVSRKDKLSQKWFRQRMRLLSEYRDCLQTARKIGKGLGDAFAWVFYLSDRELLCEHLKHQPVTLTPGGIGGRGELEFIKNHTMFRKFFPIYHCITTFLRLGDFSLIDTHSHKVSGLAELKTKQTAPNKLTVVAHLVGTEKLDGLANGKVKAPNGRKPIFPRNIRKRLKKQLKEIGGAFIDRKDKDRIEQDIYKAYHVEVMNDLAVALQDQHAVYKKAGEGLLFVGVRGNKRKSLAGRLMSKGRNFTGLENVPKHTMQIIDTDAADNALYVDSIDVTILTGGTPLAFWPVDMDFLRDIYFQKVAIVVIYNPIYLLSKLEKKGFKVSKDHGGKKYVIKKKFHGHELKIGNFEYFLRVVHKHLLTETAVIEIAESVIEEVEQEDISPNSRLDLRIFHNLVNLQ